jgi:hypothetical protein
MAQKNLQWMLLGIILVLVGCVSALVILVIKHNVDLSPLLWVLVGAVISVGMAMIIVPLTRP